MTNTILSDEAKRINRIRKRWINYDARWCIFCGLMAFPFFLYTIINHPLLGTCILLPLLGLTPYFLSRWSAQRFLRRLSKEDRELIIRVADNLNTSNLNTNPDFGYLLKACRIDAQKEYLRPSQPAQDDTLLRAAAHTETTPQDQLLRPSDNDNPQS